MSGLSFAGWDKTEGNHLTFAWEVETSDPKVLECYRPDFKKIDFTEIQSLGTSENNRIKVFPIGKQPIEKEIDKEFWGKLLSCKNNEEAIDKLWLDQLEWKRRNLSDFVRVCFKINYDHYRLISTRKTLKDVPLAKTLKQERVPELCEIITDGKVDTLGELTQQLTSLHTQFGKARSYHVHVVFPIPSGSNTSRNAIHKQIVGLVILLNNQGWLRSVISFTNKGMLMCNSTLTKGCANSIEQFLNSEEELGIDEDFTTTAKQLCVGFRYSVYDVNKEKRNVVGLEFRSGWSPKELIDLLPIVVKVIGNLGTNENSNMFAECMRTFADESPQIGYECIQGVDKNVKRFLRVLAMHAHLILPKGEIPSRAMVLLGQFASKGLNVKEKLSLLTEYTPEWICKCGVQHSNSRHCTDCKMTSPAKEFRHVILEQWSFAFVPWETHPLVPDSHRSKIKSARMELITQIVKIANNNKWWTEQSIGKTYDKQAREAINLVWAAIVEWHNKVKPEQYFTLEACLKKCSSELDEKK